MIHIDRLKNVRKIITHADCHDGLASALILKDALPNAEIVFLAHGSKEHRELPIEEGALFCDFTPRHEQVPEWLAANVIVLDHHVTQRGVVEALGGVYTEDRSGALLAFEEVWKPIMCAVYSPQPTGALVKRFAARASVRDLWQTKHEDWQAACEQAATLMFWGWDALRAMTPHIWGSVAFLDVGERLLEQRDAECREAVKNGYRTELFETKIIIFQGAHLTSDVAELLGDEVEIVVGFSFLMRDGIPSIRFSTRSHTGFDCAELASRNGGGGHKAAAGFSTFAGDPYTMFARAFEQES